MNEEPEFNPAMHKKFRFLKRPLHDGVEKLIGMGSIGGPADGWEG